MTDVWDWIYFLSLFDHALKQMATVYGKHKKKKDDSWKDMTLLELQGRFWEEMDEYDESDTDSPEEIHELIDVLNVGLMLLTKLLTPENQEGEL